MRKSEVVAYFGTQRAAALALGIEQPAIAAWDEDEIPKLRQVQLERITNGVLKADPSCYVPPMKPIKTTNSA